MMPTLLLRVWLQEINDVDLQHIEDVPIRHLDSSDRPVGKLDQDHSKCWIRMQRLGAEIEYTVQQMVDLYNVHSVEEELYGDKLPKDCCEKYRRDVGTILEGIKPSCIEYQVMQHAFQTGLAHFADKKGVIGIRRNFEIVIRENDDRGDSHDHLKGLQDFVERGKDSLYEGIASALKNMTAEPKADSAKKNSESATSA